MQADGGQLRAENNIFSSGPDEGDDAIRGIWAGSGNVFLVVAMATPQQPGIFTPPYEYTLDPIDTESEREALQADLEANAGWQSFEIPEPSTLVIGCMYFLLACLLGRFLHEGGR